MEVLLVGPLQRPSYPSSYPQYPTQTNRLVGAPEWQEQWTHRRREERLRQEVGLVQQEDQVPTSQKRSFLLLPSSPRAAQA